jgi:hypothetical protein
VLWGEYYLDPTHLPCCGLGHDTHSVPRGGGQFALNPPRPWPPATLECRVTLKRTLDFNLLLSPTSLKQRWCMPAVPAAAMSSGSSFILALAAESTLLYQPLLSPLQPPWPSFQARKPKGGCLSTPGLSGKNMATCRGSWANGWQGPPPWVGYMASRFCQLLLSPCPGKAVCPRVSPHSRQQSLALSQRIQKLKRVGSHSRQNI